MITPLPPYPAALVRTKKTRIMVIADLHIGWEMSLSKKGIHVPTQTPKLLKKLATLVSEYKPAKLLILGDVKHTIATAQIGEWQDVPEFFNQLTKQKLQTSVIRGNHDGNLEPLLPENIELLPATGIALGDIGFFHGHKWPFPAILKCKTLVMGHIHPTVAFHDPSGFRITRQVWVKANCNRKQLAEILLQKHKTSNKRGSDELGKNCAGTTEVLQLFIMPSFNDFLGGKPLNESSKTTPRTEMIVGPLLRQKAVDLENAETYLLDGTFLGTLKQLKTSS